MGWVLLGLIKNRVGFGFKKKKPEAGPGRVRVFVKTWLELGPEPTWLQVNTKKTLLYIYIYIYTLINPKTNPLSFHNTHSELTSRLSLLPLSLTLNLTAGPS